MKKSTNKPSRTTLRNRFFRLPASLLSDDEDTGKKTSKKTSKKGSLVGLAAGAAGIAGVAALVLSSDNLLDSLKNLFSTKDIDNKEKSPLKPTEEKAVNAAVKPSIEKTVESIDIEPVEVLPEEPVALPPEPVKPEPAKPEVVKPPKPKQEDVGLLEKAKKFFMPKTEEPVTKPSEKKVYSSDLKGSLNKGYRSKFTFTGFKGAEKISSDGSYTEAEANQIIALKQTGANTSANAGKMSQDIEDRIRFYANKHGINENVALQMAQVESGGNPNAISATGAIGVYQFVGRTATEYGITDRFDVDQNIEGGILLAKKNAASLKAADLPPTATNIYLSHQLGATGARELIKGAAEGKAISQLSANTRKAVSNNFGSHLKTAKEYLALTDSALEARSAPTKFASGAVLKGTSDTSNVKTASAVIAPMPEVQVKSKSSAKPVSASIASAPPEQPASKKVQTASAPPTRVAANSGSSSSKPNNAKPQALARTREGLIVDVS